jgi:uncharacterized membrane-anchored protein YhcB (DUF1043 family)
MAEVKVKVTAQNETRTGFQQALNDAKQFGNEATRSVTIDDEAALAPLRKIQQQLRDIQSDARQPISAGEISAAGGGASITATESRRAATAVRGLAADLSSATSPAQAFEAVLVRLAQSVGRLTTLVVGVAIGKIIAGQIDKITQAIDQFQSRLPSLRNELEGLSTATNFDSAISSFKRLNEAADEAIRKAQELRANPFTAAANVVARGISGTDGIAFLEGQSADLRAAAARNLRVGAGSELRDAQARAAVAGDKDAEAALVRRQKRESEINALIKERAQAQDRINAAEAARPQRGTGRPGLTGVRGDQGDSAQTAADRAIVDELNKVIARRREIAAIDDQILAKLKEQARAVEAIASRQQAAATSRQIADFGADPATLLARAQERLSALQNPAIAANIGLSEEQALAERRALELEIVNLRKQQSAEGEKQVDQARRAAQTLASALEEREFAGLSPADKQAKIAADTAALIAGAESGAISPADAAQRALELQRREDALAGGAGGFAGDFGASALQRVGGASEEFFRVRPEENKEQKKTNAILEKIKTALEKGETLVLKGSQ